MMDVRKSDDPRSVLRKLHCNQRLGDAQPRRTNLVKSPDLRGRAAVRKAWAAAKNLFYSTMVFVMLPIFGWREGP